MLRAFAGGALFGEVRGEAPRHVLALHGWARDHTDFDRVLDGLPSVALDLPGFGASPPPPEAWGSPEYADAVAAALDDLAAPVVVLAHSFGGRVAVHLAATRPDAVGALVLTGVPLFKASAGGGSAPPFGYRVVRWLHRRGLVSDERMEDGRRKYGSADYAAASGVMRDVMVKAVNETYDDVLARVACPVELVWAGADTAAPVVVAERAAAVLADGRLTVLDGVGHVEAPRAGATELRAAIERHLPGASA